MQSTLFQETASRAEIELPGSNLHVAIIMDGNGRWAQRRGLPRQVGHRRGVEAARNIIEAASENGIGTLSLYAFSSDNWRRPGAEVSALMSLLRSYLRTEVRKLVGNGIRLTAIGRRDRLPADIASAIEHAEFVTADGAKLRLRIALDYSARDSILQAAARVVEADDLTRAGFANLITGECDLREVDLLIRTGGEQRLSDFLLWECAYAELYFTERLWPDFTPNDLAVAIAELRKRERRFGGLNQTAVVA
jgi:undecaprenyl diphosphate synthase